MCQNPFTEFFKTILKFIFWFISQYRFCFRNIGKIMTNISKSEKPGDEPYYPVNDDRNGDLYRQYKALADAEEQVIFGGRLGEYKYYDMDAVIASALSKCAELF